MGPFDPSTENWISYEERFRLYLAANEVASDEKKQAIFLTTCGTSTYNLLRSLAAPKEAARANLRRARQARSWTLSPETVTRRPALQIFFALSPRWRICRRIRRRTQTTVGALCFWRCAPGHAAGQTGLRNPRSKNTAQTTCRD